MGTGAVGAETEPDQIAAHGAVRGLELLGEPLEPDTLLAVDGWLFTYNHHRHQALGRQTPITRLNNLLGSYT